MLFGLMYPASASPLRGLPYYSISTMVRMLSNWRSAATARLTGAFAMANHHRQRPTFGAARVAFEAEWAVFVARRSEADFQWREARDKREQKHAMWVRGEKLPTQLPNSMMRCPVESGVRGTGRKRISYTRCTSTPPRRATENNDEIDDRPAVRQSRARRTQIARDRQGCSARTGRPYPHREDQRAVPVQGAGQPAEYGAGLKLAIERGGLWIHESGTYVKVTQTGAELLAI
jgi:hypothetical protein